jgi:hypothetical protein
MVFKERLEKKLDEVLRGVITCEKPLDVWVDLE